jgi:phosphoglycerate kinase
MALFRDVVLKSSTVIWNGPAGVFEFDNFSAGTKALLEAVAETTANGNTGIIGGGDSATAAAKWDMEDKVTFVSTGGGVSLELLEGKLHAYGYRPYYSRPLSHFIVLLSR